MRRRIVVNLNEIDYTVELLDFDGGRVVCVIDGKQVVAHIKSPCYGSQLLFLNLKESEVIKAPFSGVVTKILVQTGQTVNVSCPILIIEAMKMENRITAPCDAIVEGILVAEKDRVEKGQVLIRLKPIQ
ncbi:MAG: acetyl-CoA carboxylase biotin carboxyl carrier protein subunit [Deltaproteobacteria bacterium]|nr:acetyl-CoA carboxylase biotin carboxyl carrier protein subunit [Deltaproteobacteria bacterium]